MNEEFKMDDHSADPRNSTTSLPSSRDAAEVPTRLQLFYSELEGEDRHVAGFGWMNQS